MYVPPNNNRELCKKLAVSKTFSDACLYFIVKWNFYPIRQALTAYDDGRGYYDRALKRIFVIVVCRQFWKDHRLSFARRPNLDKEHSIIIEILKQLLIASQKCKVYSVDFSTFRNLVIQKYVYVSRFKRFYVNIIFTYEVNLKL